MAEDLATQLTQVKDFCVVIPCIVMAGYHCFRGLCYLHLEGEIARMGENGINIGLDWRGAAGASSQ
jgi:hypothetical protein